MKVTFTFGNTKQPFQLIRATGGKRASASETVNKADGTHKQTRRLGRGPDYFGAEFSLPTIMTIPPISEIQVTRPVESGPPTRTEINDCIQTLKRYKAGGPDNIQPTHFKEGRASFNNALARMFQVIWRTEKIPFKWGHTIIAPIIKNGCQQFL